MLCICRKHVRALAVLLLALGGCAGPLQYKQLTNTAHGLPPAHELSGTAFYPQQIHHCGPAALATVLAAAGVSTTPEELSQLVYLPQREGSLSIELTAAVRHFGYLSYELQPRLQDLLTEIASGHPVLVLQNLGLSWLPRWHYAVAIGYNLQEETIILRSGAHRRVLTDIATFERTWRRGDYWALLVLPPGTMPALADELHYLDASVGLEHTGHWQAAHNSYRAAVERWPHSLTAWMGLGNSAYAVGNLAAAAQAYRKALLIDEHYAPAYNNLAQTLADRKQWAEAEYMAQRAVDIGGNHMADYQQTLQDILQRKNAADQK